MALIFEDITVGMDIPPIVHGPVGTSEIVRYSTTVENYEPLHHDPDWCRERGLPHILVGGPLKMAMLASLVRRWIGPTGFIRSVSCSHRGMDLPGCTLAASGRVLRKWIQDGLGYAECEIKVTNDRGQATCLGKAIVIVPLRGQTSIPKAYPPAPESYAWAFRDGSPVA